jgi:hypothetical protein
MLSAEAQAERMPRVTLLEVMILLAILALACSLPIQCQRDQDRANCRFLAKDHAGVAAVLTIMANHPAVWMDEFRPELRRLASWEMSQSQRLARSETYSDTEEFRIAEEFKPAHAERLFWARFDMVAARHGYRKPKLYRGPQSPIQSIVGYLAGTETPMWSIVGFLARSWPTHVTILFLARVLVISHRTQKRRHMVIHEL